MSIFIPGDFLDQGIDVDWKWALCSVAGAVEIGLLTYRPDLLRSRVLDLLGLEHATPWERWHVAALFWTVLVLVYCFFKFVKQIDTSNYQLCFFVACAGVLGVIYLARFISGDSAPIIQAIFVGLGFCLIDFIAWRGMKAPTEKHRIAQTLILADLPSFVAFLLLAIWFTGHKQDAGAMEPFVYGAISFQLLSSKVMFMLIEGGALD